VNKLEEQHAGHNHRGAGKKKSGAKDQRNAVLRSLETNQRYCRKQKGKQTGGNLQVTLQYGIGPGGDLPQPVGRTEDQNESCYMKQDAVKLAPVAVARNESKLAHGGRLVQPRAKAASPSYY
jgi:hypothetical protein